MNKRLAALLVVPALALSAGLFAVGTAAASPAGAGGGQVCRKPVTADGLQVQTCGEFGDGGYAIGTVSTTGSNNTQINLCVELVDVNQNLVPGSRNCQIQQGSAGHVETPTMYPPAGTYYAVSYFTSPTYWYGGETPAFPVS